MSDSIEEARRRLRELDKTMNEALSTPDSEERPLTSYDEHLRGSGGEPQQGYMVDITTRSVRSVALDETVLREHAKKMRMPFRINAHGEERARIFEGEEAFYYTGEWQEVKGRHSKFYPVYQSQSGRTILPHRWGWDYDPTIA